MQIRKQLNDIKSYAPAVLGLHSPITSYPYTITDNTGISIPCTIVFEECRGELSNPPNPLIGMIVVMDGLHPEHDRVCIAHGTEKGWKRFGSALSKKFWMMFYSIKQDIDIDRAMLEACIEMLEFEEYTSASSIGMETVFTLGEIEAHIANTSK